MRYASTLFAFTAMVVSSSTVGLPKVYAQASRPKATTAYSKERTNKFRKPFVALLEARNTFDCTFRESLHQSDVLKRFGGFIQAFATYDKEVLAVQDACYDIEESVEVRSSLSKLRAAIKSADTAITVCFAPRLKEDQPSVEEHKANFETLIKSLTLMSYTYGSTLKSMFDATGIGSAGLIETAPPHLDFKLIDALNGIYPKSGSFDKVVIGYAPKESGLVAGDVILNIRRPSQDHLTKVTGWNDLRDFLTKYPGLLYVMQIRRGDAEQEVTVKIKDGE